MRTRVLLGGAALGFVLVMGPVGAAHAAPAPTTKKLDKAVTECIDKLEAGKAVDDCHKAPSPILPEKNEIIWGGISFLIVVVALGKFLVPALQKGMASRAQHITTDLNSAESAKLEAQKLLDDYRAQLADARSDANRILDEARQQAEVVRREVLARAESEAAAVRAKAADDTTIQSERLKVELEAYVKQLSIELAEKVMGANLNTDTNAALIDRYIAELGAR